MRSLPIPVSLLVLAVCAGAQTFTINTVAGGGLPPTPMAATSAPVQPNWVATDKAGNIYFSTSQAVFKVGTSGTMTRVAGAPGGGNPLGDGGPATSAYLNQPAGIAVDTTGNVYIADAQNDRVRKVTPGGIISTVAGNGNWGYSGDSGPATSAKLNWPQGLAVDSAGNLYIADYYNSVVRKVTPDGIISTVAGTGTRGYTGDGGPATSATLSYPRAVAVDSSGSLYIADSGNSVVREVTSSGIISSVALTGGWVCSQISGVSAVAVDSSGDLYIRGNTEVVKVTASATTVVVVNTGQYAPVNLAVDSSGTLYFTDVGERVYMVTPAGPSAVAGNGSLAFGDGGPATSAGLWGPAGVAVDSAGNLYIADAATVRKVTPSGRISTVAGGGTSVPGDGGPATSAGLFGTFGIAVDGAGNLYFAETNSDVVRKVTPAGVISTVAGNRGPGYSCGIIAEGASATAIKLCGPRGVAVDSAGNVFIADMNANRVFKVTPSGTISTVAGGGFYPNTGDGGPATKAYVGGPLGIALDAAGNLYIAEGTDNRVRKVTADGIISTVAGNGTYSWLDTDGPATGVGLTVSGGVAVDSAGNIYVVEPWWIRKVTTDGVISTIAGNGTLGYSGDGGPAIEATFNNPNLLAIDSAGRIYVADTVNGAVRMLTPVLSPPSISTGGVVPVYSSVGTIQPGEWVSIYGSDLASATAIWNQDFPISLAGTSVTIDGKPAYLWYVSPTQINVQAPDDAVTGPVQVAVTTAAGTATSTVTLASAAPAFLLLDGKHVTGIIPRKDGSGAHGGGSYDIIGPTGNSLGYPTVAAKVGETVELYAVGFGPTVPAVPAGQPYTGAAPTTNSVSVQIGGVRVAPLFAGISEAGLYQINLTIQPGTGTGDLPIVASVGGTGTQAGVVISVQ